MLARAAMFIQGDSTRKVTAITERLSGSETISNKAGRTAALLNEADASGRRAPSYTCMQIKLDANVLL